MIRKGDIVVDITKKIEDEKNNIEFMINLYCKKNHKEIGLCNDCQELLTFAKMRIDKCPVKETKTFCSSCHIHCYPKVKRESIRTIMKWSGPRMLIYNPPLAIKHIINTVKHKVRSKKEKQ